MLIDAAPCSNASSGTNTVAKRKKNLVMSNSNKEVVDFNSCQLKVAERLAGKIQVRFILGSAHAPADTQSKLRNYYDIDETWICLLSSDDGFTASSSRIFASKTAALEDAAERIIEQCKEALLQEQLSPRAVKRREEAVAKYASLSFADDVDPTEDDVMEYSEIGSTSCCSMSLSPARIERPCSAAPILVRATSASSSTSSTSSSATSLSSCSQSPRKSKKKKSKKKKQNEPVDETAGRLTHSDERPASVELSVSGKNRLKTAITSKLRRLTSGGKTSGNVEFSDPVFVSSTNERHKKMLLKE